MATASGEEDGWTRSRSRPNLSSLIIRAKSPSGGMAKAGGGSRGLRRAIPERESSVSEEKCQRQEYEGVEGGVEGPLLKRCEGLGSPFSATSQQFQDPRRNSNRNARATNRGPRPLRPNGPRRRAGHCGPSWLCGLGGPLSASPH